MTLINCQNLLKHYESIINGTFPKTPNHKDWDLVVKNAKINAEGCRKLLERYEARNPTEKPKPPVEKETKPKEVKKDVKGSA